MTAEEFTAGYCERSGITRAEFFAGKVVLPCACAEEGCNGWARVSDDQQDVALHMGMRAPQDITGPALFIPLKTKFYREFERGDKTTEFRPYGPRWNERTCAIGRPVVLSMGYGKGQRLRGVVAAFSASVEPSKSDAWRSCYGDEPQSVACIRIALFDQQP
ncbi:hypothetical protein [Nevskia ramosa]|uniref:hypothetical protein n=1 Tax=Nevskia ramosa TaxID=64002 RepID=UPI003D0AEC82